MDPILALRALASLVIVWYHNAPPSYWFSLGTVNIGPLFHMNGAIAVYIFYILSGYSVGYGFAAGNYRVSSLRSVALFFGKRFIKIAPPYYACLAIAAIFFFSHIPLTSATIARLVSFTANFDYLRQIPYLKLLVILSTEMQFYLISPLLYVAIAYMTKKIHPVFTAVLILILGYTIRQALYTLGFASNLEGFMVNVYVTVWGMLDYFLFGMLTGYVVVRHSDYIRRFFIRGALPVYYFLAVMYIFWLNAYSTIHQPFSSYIIRHLFTIPPGLCLVIGLYIVLTRRRARGAYRLMSPGGILSNIRTPHRYLYSIGSLSYGIYLYHDIFADLWFRSPGRIPMDIPSFFSRYGITLGTAIVFAFISYVFIEYPLYKLMHRKKRTTPSSDRIPAFSAIPTTMRLQSEAIPQHPEEISSAGTHR